MPPLRKVQKAVAQSVLAHDASVAASHIVDDAIAATDRLCIYRNTFVSTLTGALRLTFPVGEPLVVPEFFAASAAGFIQRRPPRRSTYESIISGTTPSARIRK